MDDKPSDTDESIEQGVDKQAGVLSRPTLVYLFAGSFAPENTTRAKLKYAATAGTKAPSQDIQVATGPLAATILAVAFWDLQQQGSIRLEVVPTKRLFGLMKGSELEASLLDQREISGLEGELLRVWIEHPGASVHEVIQWWFGGKVSDPWQIVVGYERENAVRSGYLMPSGEADSDTHPNRNRITTLQARADELVREWNGFKTANSVLFQAVYKACNGALFSCKASTDDGNGGDAYDPVDS